VAFAFPEDLSAADEEEMRRLIEAFPEAIGEMTAIRLGPSMYTDRIRGHQYLMYMEFPDEAALLRYRDHPVHRAFQAWTAARGNVAMVFDYEIDDSTVIL
jgi:hypothetical protein